MRGPGSLWWIFLCVVSSLELFMCFEWIGVQWLSGGLNPYLGRKWKSGFEYWEGKSLFDFFS